MEREDVLKLCPRFIAKLDKQTGKTRCVNLIPNDGGPHMCSLPNEFLCVVSQYLESLRMREDYRSKGMSLWSVSRISAAASCMRRYWLQYVLHKPQPEKPAYWLGKEFAKARAAIVTGKEWQLENVPEDLGGPAAMTADTIRLEELLRAMSLKGGWPKGPNEGHVSAIIDSKIAVHGFLDQMSEDGKTIYEWKYAQNEGMYSLVTIHPQACMYLKCCPQVEDFELWIAKKGKEKMKAGTAKKAGETPDEFRARMRTKAEANQLFNRRVYKRSEFDIDGQFAEFEATIAYIDYCTTRDVWPKNTSHCDFCPMKQPCRELYGIKADEVADADEAEAEGA